MVTTGVVLLGWRPGCRCWQYLSQVNLGSWHSDSRLSSRISSHCRAHPTRLKLGGASGGGMTPGTPKLADDASPAKRLVIKTSRVTATRRDLSVCVGTINGTEGWGIGAKVHEPPSQQSKRSGHPKYSVKSTKGKPGGRSGRAVIAARRTASLDPRSNYELFNCNNFNIRYCHILVSIPHPCRDVRQ